MTIEVANRLYELRKKHNLSQEELAEKLGVSRQAVSKWERSEASPDTDNLIALAKIYGLSLDELLYGEKQTDEEHSEQTSDGEQYIYVDDDDNPGKKTKVKICADGIFVEDEDGDNVEISLKGIKINESTIKEKIIYEENKKSKLWLEIPYPIICVVAYLVFGCLDILGGWALSWIIFITIPIYYTLVQAIYKRRFSEFTYPVFTVFAYLYLGLYHGNWHPSWILFLTIPIYYSIAGIIDKKIHSRDKK